MNKFKMTHDEACLRVLEFSKETVMDFFISHGIPKVDEEFIIKYAKNTYKIANEDIENTFIDLYYAMKESGRFDKKPKKKKVDENVSPKHKKELLKAAREAYIRKVLQGLPATKVMVYGTRIDYPITEEEIKNLQNCKKENVQKN